MSKPPCPRCMREQHDGLSCTEAGLRADYGKEVGRQPPRCKKCNREHWPYRSCSLRSPEEEALYRSQLRG